MPVHFHIPGIVQTYHLNQLLLMLRAQYPDAFRPDTDIASIYGEFPSSQWNGGRVAGGRLSEEDMKYIIEGINSRGVSLRYTSSYVGTFAGSHLLNVSPASYY